MHLPHEKGVQMQRLEIFDLDSEGALSFDLKTLLPLLPNRVHSKQWYLLDLEAAGTPGGADNLLAVAARVRTAANGLRLDWNRLVQLAGHIHQVIDMTLVGIDPLQREPSKAFTNSDYSEFALFEVIDSSLWVVESDMECVLNVVKRAFHDVRVADPTIRRP
jgi:hypothetical protein